MSSNSRKLALPGCLILFGLTLIGVFAVLDNTAGRNGAAVQPTITIPAEQILVPTRTPIAQASVTTHTPTAQMSVTTRERFGVAGGNRDIKLASEQGLPFGSYVNWRTEETLPISRTSAIFWQMIRVDESGIRYRTWDDIAQIIAAQPGSFWLIGNEPDVIWQDNTTPQRYAQIYHDAYYFIKERDATAQVAIAGVSQPTPLRMAYLDIVLDSYEALYGEPLPVDIWNVHAFVLREQYDSWGVEIPPGMNDELAILYEIEQHGDIEIFKENLIAFRAWMAERGYRDRPLVVTEYGILMPNDFGYPPERIEAFMTATFDFFMTATNETGYPADGNRLVQWWFWYSLYDDGEYSASNLYDLPSEGFTPLGDAFQAYVFAAEQNGR